MTYGCGDDDDGGIDGPGGAGVGLNLPCAAAA
jgi:hypothetical protein